MIFTNFPVSCLTDVTLYYCSNYRLCVVFFVECGVKGTAVEYLADLADFLSIECLSEKAPAIIAALGGIKFSSYIFRKLF